MTQSSSLDRALCPVCGAQNSCAIAAGSNEPCWCMAANFSDAALARVPEAARGVACLCPRCAAFQAQQPARSAEPKLP